MAKKTLRQRRHDATNEELIRAAEVVMVRNGFDNVTMRDIAAEAGCSSATLYQYFADKKELLTEIFGRYFDALVQTIEERLQSETDPVERLRVDARCAMEHLAKNRALVRLFRAQLPAGRKGPLEYLPKSSRDRLRRFDRDMVENIKAAQEMGRVRRDVPAEVLRAFFRRHVAAACEVLDLGEGSSATEEDFRIAWSLLAGAMGIKEG